MRHDGDELAVTEADGTQIGLWRFEKIMLGETVYIGLVASMVCPLRGLSLESQQQGVMCVG